MSPQPPSLQDLYLRELDRIERIVAFVARRNGLREQLLDDFRSEVHVHLIEDEYRVLREFDGRSRLGTYLVVVVQRLLADFRDRRWGRWRPSAAAKRAGEAGVLLETLVVRDGLDFSEAVRMLRRNHGIERSRDELYALLQTFPSRHGRASRRRVALENVAEPTAAETAADALEEHAMGDLEALLVRTLRERIDGLPAEDRLVLRMVYLDGRNVSTVARTLDLDQRRLYRRLERLRETLRKALVENDVDPDRVQDLLDSRRSLQNVGIDEILGRRPSHRERGLGRGGEARSG